LHTFRHLNLIILVISVAPLVEWFLRRLGIIFRIFFKHDHDLIINLPLLIGMGGSFFSVHGLQ